MRAKEFINEEDIHPNYDEFMKPGPFSETTLFHLPVYHATNNEFDKFERAGHGIFISQHYDYAAEHYGSNVIPLYIDVRKPFNDLDAPHVDAAFERDYKTLAVELEKLKSKGYDAAYIGGDGNSYILIGDVPIVHAVTGKEM